MSARFCLVLGLATACAPLPQRGPAAAAVAERPVALVTVPQGGPTTWVQIAVRAGSAFDPVGKDGLASLSARLLREGGAGDRSPEDVDDLLYRLGTDVEVVVGKELVTIRTRALNEDLGELLPVVADMITAPARDGAALVRLRDEAADHLRKGLLESDEALGQEVFDTWLYEAHPYGHPVEGRAGTIDALDGEDVEAFLGSAYLRSAVTLGISGPAALPDGRIDPSAPGGDALVALRQSLSTLPAAILDPPTPRRVPVVEGRELLVVEKPGSGTGIHFGHPTALHRAHPDWPAMLLAMTAFGEHRQSHGRLYRELRGARGLNYGDYAYIERFEQAGWSSDQETGTGRLQNPFTVWVRPTTVRNGPFALRGALALTEELVQDGLGEDEFTRVQEYLGGRLLLWAVDPGRRLGWALEAGAMGWPDPLATLPEQVAALDRATVNAALQEHLHPDDLRIVVVTPEGEDFAKAVSPDTTSLILYEDGAAPPADSEQARRDAAWSKLPVRLEASRVIPADGVLQ